MNKGIFFYLFNLHKSLSLWWNLTGTNKKQIAHSSDVMMNKLSMLAWRNSGCSTNTPPCSYSRVPTLFMNNVCCVCGKASSPFILLSFYWTCEDNKGVRGQMGEIEGSVGVIPHWSFGMLCNQRWEYYYSTKVPLSHMLGLWGTGSSSKSDPPLLSVLCVADGRRSGPSESSWNSLWNRYSRLGNKNIDICFVNIQIPY